MNFDLTVFSDDGKSGRVFQFWQTSPWSTVPSLILLQPATHSTQSSVILYSWLT